MSGEAGSGLPFVVLSNQEAKVSKVLVRVLDGWGLLPDTLYLPLCTAGAAARGAVASDAAGAERPRAAVRGPQVRAPGRSDSALLMCLIWLGGFSCHGLCQFSAVFNGLHRARSY